MLNCVLGEKNYKIIKRTKLGIRERQIQVQLLPLNLRIKSLAQSIISESKQNG